MMRPLPPTGHTDGVAKPRTESLALTLARRSITIPGYLLAWLAWVAVAPVTLPALAIFDTVMRRRLALTRAYLMALVYLTAEVAGLAVITWHTLQRRRMSDAEWVERHFRLEAWWGRAQWRWAIRIFRLRVVVEGEDALDEKPFILFPRHVSVVDNMIPAVFALDRAGAKMRWVLNRSLLRDPCIDIVGQRLPNCFVKGSSQDSSRELARLRAAADGLGKGEAVVLFPEGTLFSPAKRRRVIEKLRAGDDPELLRWAEHYRNVMPPRIGGPLALLETCPGVDVVFCAHSGLELALNKQSIIAGALIDREIRVVFWRVPAKEIPWDTRERRDWLFAEWAKVDAIAAAGHGREIEGVEVP